MFCTSCGNTLNEADKFCAQCGKANQPGPGEARASYSFTPPPPRAPLARSMADKKIAGVCAGFARYLDWDVTLIRILAIAGIFLHGIGLIAYIVAWIAMPRDDRQPQAVVAG